MNKMKTKLNIIGIITIILILCLNNFAAIVSDNEGSAFSNKFSKKFGGQIYVKRKN